MKWLVLCREPRLYSCERLKQACEAKGIELDILDPNKMSLKLVKQQNNVQCEVWYQAGDNPKNRQVPVEISDYQAVLPRFGTSSTEMGCRVVQLFEALGIPTLNTAQAIGLARDKWQSLQALAANHIPIPTSSLSGSLFEKKSAVQWHSSPVVIKTLVGSQGIGVMLSDNQPQAVSLLETFTQTNIQALLQDFVPEAKGQDIRAFVIGNQVVAAMQRSGAKNDFRANLHQGGQAKKIELSQALQDLAVRAARVIGLDVAGVDLIQSADGFLVLEVNASPGLEGIEQATGVNIAKQMVEYLFAKKEKTV